MRVFLLVLLLLCLAALEYFYHFSAHMQSAEFTDVTTPVKSAPVRPPPQHEHHSH